MAVGEVIKEVARQLAEEADVRAVFGDPLKLGQRTVIPVAIVRIRLTLGSGGLADLSATPVGFICEEDGEVVFKPIAVGARGPQRRAGQSKR
jgi:uncharacterized spore protein YtfJ